MTIMPAFHNWPAEAAIISRLLGYYGELEFMMGICLGHALSDRRKALKVLFRTRGETPRINLADALTHDCFLHVEHQMNANRGGPKSIAFPMPAKRQPPPELDPLAQDILGLLPSGP